jgi:hypothetical protein
MGENATADDRHRLPDSGMMVVHGEGEQSLLARAVGG